MLMPEATVKKYDLLPAWKHEIWLTRKVFHVKAISVPESMNETPKLKLRLAAFAPDSTHILASFFRRLYIHF